MCLYRRKGTAVSLACSSSWPPTSSVFYVDTPNISTSILRRTLSRGTHISSLLLTPSNHQILTNSLTRPPSVPRTQRTPQPRQSLLRPGELGTTLRDQAQVRSEWPVPELPLTCGYGWEGCGCWEAAAAFSLTCFTGQKCKKGLKMISSERFKWPVFDLLGAFSMYSNLLLIDIYHDTDILPTKWLKSANYAQTGETKTFYTFSSLSVVRRCRIKCTLMKENLP